MSSKYLAGSSIYLAGFDTLFPLCCQHICPNVWRNCQMGKKVNKMPDYHCHNIWIGMSKYLKSIVRLFDIDHKQYLAWYNWNHTSNLSRIPRVYPCKFLLAGVNFFRFYAKIWQFIVYFAVIYVFFLCKFYSPKILLV